MTINTINTVNTTKIQIGGYVSGVTKVSNASTHRLASISFKTDKITGVKRDSVSVSLPLMTPQYISDNLALLFPALSTYLYSVQNDVLRDSVLEGLSEVKASEFEAPALAKFLAQVSTGERITREYLSAWFDESASSSLTVAIATKLGITDTTLETDDKFVKLAGTLETYKSFIMKLAGTKTAFSIEVIAALKKALAVLDQADKITQYLLDKLEAMTQKGQIELLAL